MTLTDVLGRRTALVVIDMQNDYCHPDGSFGRRGATLTPPLASTVENLRRLASAARETGVPVIFIRTGHGPWSDSPTWLGRLRGIPGVDKLPVCAEGTWGAEFYGLDPAPGDRVVTKHRYSAFVNTQLPLYLRSLEVRTLVCCGVVTNVCVESTAREAFMNDFHVVTVSDACSATSTEEHEGALFNLDRYFGRVETTDAILACWQENPTREVAR